jgi:hypothetical protein
VFEWGRIFGPGSKYFATVLSDEDGVLKLCRSLTICGNTSPLIVPGDILPHSHIDHRLNGEDMSWFHETNCLVLGVVGNLRSLMEHPSDSMTLVRSHNGVAHWLNMLRDNVSHLFVHGTRLALFDALL